MISVNGKIKMKSFNENDIQLFVQKYESSGGIEYFVSFETKDQRNLYGFCRLRLNNHWNDVVSYLHGHVSKSENYTYMENILELILQIILVHNTKVLVQKL